MRKALIVALLLVIGYGGNRYMELSKEHERFEDAWEKITAEELPGSHSYDWKPGILAAVGTMKLPSCELTNAHVFHLQDLKSLVELDLSDNRITDGGLENLNGLTSLKRLDLSGNDVTDDAVNALRQALPDCEIDSG